MPAVPDFLPSRNAPLFRNGPWPPGTGIPITLPGFKPILFDRTKAGFCGGMAFVTREIFEAGTPQLRGKDAVLLPLQVAQYLMFHTIDAFAPVMGQWLHATSELDHSTLFGGKGLFAETVEGCATVTATIDSGRLCPIGVVLTQSTVPFTVFDNHVELVYAYERNGNTLKLHVYDCNSGGATDPTALDDDYISLDVSSTTPAKPIETNASSIDGQPGRIRGFFPLPFAFKDPAPVYIDSSNALQVVRPPREMAPRARAQTRVSFLNDGSTTWTSGSHHLGGQLPLHNQRWGTTSQRLTGNIDPQQRATFDFASVAPAAVGSTPWAWQMVAGQGDVFGPMASATVLVGSQSQECKTIRTQLAANKQTLLELKMEKDSLNPRDPHDRARITVILREMAKVNAADVKLEQAAAVAGCAL